MKSRRKFGKFVAAASVAVVAGFAVNGVTAANTVPTSSVGDGAGTISGYTVSSVAYTLNGTNPQNLDTVTFTLSAAATTVKIKLVAAGSTWYSCTNPAGNNWSCDTTVGTQATSATVDELRVVAKSQ